jgi:hypothetical protein
MTKDNKNNSPESPGADNESKKPLQDHVIPMGISVYLIIGLFVVRYSQTVQAFLIHNVWPLGIAVLIFVVFGGIAWYRASAKRQIALVIFVAIPILLALAVAVSLIHGPYQVPILRSFFLLIVCFLPAMLYYLFIVSRKTSLIQEYFSILSRLGLFERQPRSSGNGQPPEQELEWERRLRVMSYFAKFESIYGPIDRNLADKILEATNLDTPKPELPASDMYTKGDASSRIFTPKTTIPVALATLLIGFGWLLTLPPWESGKSPSPSTISQMLDSVLQPGEIYAHFAFLGAYFFSLQMLFRRYVHKDLQSNAYVSVSLRIILAVIGTWAVIHAVPFLESGAQVAGGKRQALLVISFAIGAFPLIAWQMIRAAFLKITRAKSLVPSLSSEMPVSQLDGLTVWHEARLEEEDIENVPNMATADLVELMLHTRIPPDRIVDWVDQAMLYTQLGLEKEPDNGKDGQAVSKSLRQRLGEHGIRTASALVTAYKECVSGEDVRDFENILPNEGRSRIRTLVNTLSTNPNLELVLQWRRLPNHE